MAKTSPTRKRPKGRETVLVTISMYPDDRARYERICEREHMTMSAFLRRAANELAARMEKE